MSTPLLACAHRSGRGDGLCLGESGFDVDNLGRSSIRKLELGLGRGWQGSCFGEQARIDGGRRKRGRGRGCHQDSFSGSNRVRSAGCGCQDGCFVRDSSGGSVGCAALET